MASSTVMFSLDLTCVQANGCGVQSPYLLYVGDVSDAERNSVNIELIVIERELFCIAHDPRKTFKHVTTTKST